MVGIPHLHSFDLPIHALLWRADGHYWLPVQYSVSILMGVTLGRCASSQTLLSQRRLVLRQLLTLTPITFRPICQMLAGYLFPGRPLANFYFTCYTYNALQQGQLLAKDLKLAQYTHLPPQCTFLVQIMGCVVGALFNWVMM